MLEMQINADLHSATVNHVPNPSELIFMESFANPYKE